MNNRMVWITAFLLFCVEIAFGYYVAVDLKFINGDAISRVANAFYVLYSRDPHMAAIGFIWNPLPSLMALPLLLFQPLWPVLSSAGMSNVILTALFMSLTFVMLMKAFRAANSKLTGIGWVCALLLILNPFFFWYGANGMSEAVFAFCVAVAVIQWSRWIRIQSVQPLIIVAMMLCLAFLTRYEAIPFSAAIVFAALLILVERKSSFAKMESTAIVILVPVLFTVMTWLMLNYTIMGNALYFLNSSYSNAGQSDFLKDNPVMSIIIGDIKLSGIFVVKRVAVFIIPYFILFVFRLVSRQLFKWDFWTFTGIVFSIPIFQWYMLYSGLSFGWLRFFFYPLLITVAWLPYEFSSTAHSYRTHRVLKVFTVVGLIVSALIIVPVMNNPTLAPEEHAVLHYEDSETRGKTLLSQDIAKKIDDQIFKNEPNALVLADSFNAFEIILNSKNPDRYVNTTDRDFMQVLKDPTRYKVQYLLLPKPEGLSALNALNQQYPGLYEGGAEWSQLVFDMNDRWKLYKITGELQSSPHATGSRVD